MIKPRAYTHGGSLADSALDMTPLLDILFILLIFFMLTANTALHYLDIELPDADASALTPIDESESTVLEIGERAYALGGEPLNDLEALKQAVAELPPDARRRLVIAADRSVEAGRLLEVLTVLQSSNIAAAGILIRKEAHAR